MNKPGSQARNTLRNFLLVGKRLPVPLLRVGFVFGKLCFFTTHFEVQTPNVIKSMQFGL
ncbi:MAG: hypothetical protein CM15mP89_4500 [Gammaproteobacteria bacterium]|nr:MAG: hypothetical protein CM15mP89_4500 [Gammaproteobacteria bacterium]